MEGFLCSRRDFLRMSGVTAASMALTACRVQETPQTPVEPGSYGPENPFQQNLTCTQSLSDIGEQKPNVLLPEDILSFQLLTLTCDGSILGIPLLGHSIFPIPDQISFDKWGKIEQGDGSQATAFKWDRDPESGQLLIGWESNCAATVFSEIGMDIPEGNQVIVDDPREFLKVLRGFYEPLAPNQYASGIGIEIAAFNEQQFDSDPDIVMRNIKEGYIAYFITRDSNGNESYHMAICKKDPDSGLLTLYQKISSAGPSGYGRSEALKYFYENWTSMGGEADSSKIIEVHIIRPNAQFIPLQLNRIYIPQERVTSGSNYTYYTRQEACATDSNLRVTCEHISRTTVAGIIRYFCAQMVS